MPGCSAIPRVFPVQYLGANVPQAWAAGTPFMLLQAMLGLQQDAPRGKLYVDPALPDWLPDVTLTDLRLGRAALRHPLLAGRRQNTVEGTQGQSRRGR